MTHASRVRQATRKWLLPALIATSTLLITLPASGKLVETSGAQANLFWQMAPGNSAEAQTFLNSLKNGLNLSGAFRPGTAANHDFNIRGQASTSGGQLTVQTIVSSAGGAPVYNAEKRGRAADGAYLGLALADEIVEKITGQPGIATSQIIAVGNKTGSKELYLLRVGGGSPTQITRDNSIAMEPKWGPNGRFVTYTGFHMRFPDAYRIDVKSGNRTKISGDPGVNTGSVLAPNGRDVAIVLSKDGATQVYVKSGGHERRLTSDNTVKATPTWSPDGSQIAYCGNNQIWVVNARGGRPRQISTGRENVEPNWGKNNKIVYAANNGGGYRLTIYDPARGGFQTLATGGGNWTEPSWAPNGRHLVATRTSNYQSSVYVVDTLNPSNVIPITSGQPGDWSGASWSPKN